MMLLVSIASDDEATLELDGVIVYRLNGSYKSSCEYIGFQWNVFA